MTATPRPAASILVVRDSTILMGRRSAAHRFMPNMLVFPGGAVDDADHHTPAASPLNPRVHARLARSAPHTLAHALAIAAARELQEEVGLSLSTPPELGNLEYLCRAITPPERSIRFDARFFIVDASHTSGTPIASTELEDPAWYSVQDALKSAIPDATRAVLGQFQRWLTYHDKDGPVPVLDNRVWKIE